MPRTILCQLLLVACSVITLSVGAFLPSSENNKCSPNLLLKELSDTQVKGEFITAEGNIEFDANIHDDGLTILSTTDFLHPKSTIHTALSFPNVPEQKVPGMQYIVTQAASDLMESSSCQLPSNLPSVYESFSNALFHCTDSLGYTQLRYSLMYHVSVVGSAQRLCTDKVPVCTLSPTYDDEGEMFMCMEVLEDLQQEQAGPQVDAMEDGTSPRPTDVPEIKPGGDVAAMLMGKGTSSHPTDIPYGFQAQDRRKRNGCLQGSDICCCGNYSGCCYYSHWLCCAHDIVCACCDSWYCGWQCQKASFCD